MASMKMSGCMAVVSRMSQSDQDALLARLEQYQADGVPAERAQFMAANDMLEELRAERTQLFGAIAEQHPDLMTVEEKPAARFSRQRQTDTPAFKAWFGDSQVVDANGDPLVVYRGEHGRTDSGDVQTVLGTYTFVDDPDVANTYAETPNDLRMTAEQSRVVPAYLRIENPIIYNKDDPFVEFSDIAQKLGAKEAARFAQKHAGHIEATNNWEENFSRKYLSVEDLLNKNSKAIKRLYMDAYPLLDDKEFVAAAKAAGFDGAIHVGNGESMDAVEYRVFDKNQIKSATGNSGAFDRSNPDIRFSRQRSPLGFYSALAEGVDNLQTKTAPAAGWKDAIKGLVNKGQVKADEVEWSGINDWLDMQQGKVTRDQVAEYLKQGGVQVEETQLGGKRGLPKILNDYFENSTTEQPTTTEGWIAAAERQERIAQQFQANGDDARANRAFALADAMNEYAEQGETGALGTKHSTWVLPGGENYREVLLTLPERKSAPQSIPWQEYKDAGWTVDLEYNKWTDQTAYYIRDANGRVVMQRTGARGEWTEDRALEEYAKTKGADRTKEADQKLNHRSDHWDQPNVLAHIRTNDRTDADGKRVLFVEELQSDWGQEGREKGFNDQRNALDEELRRAGWALKEIGPEDWVITDRDGDVVAEGETANAVLARAGATARNVPSIPAAPFVTKTEGWLNLALKRVVTMAAEEGYDKVAFVNGQQSADRYNLSNQVRQIEVHRSDDRYLIVPTTTDYRTLATQGAANEDELARLVGKELAQKIVRDFNPDVDVKKLDVMQNEDFDSYSVYDNNDNRIGPRFETAQEARDFLAELRAGTKQPAAVGPYTKVYSGLDLDIGGKGMKVFYDQIVPAALKKLLPKVGGGKLGKVQFGGEDAETEYVLDAMDPELDEDADQEVVVRDRNTLDGVATFRSIAEADEWINEHGGMVGTSEQPGFDVTDAMRAKVAEGLPLFSRRRNIYGQQVLSTWTAPTETKIDNLIYTLQDKQVDTKRVVEAVKAAAGNIADKWNPYLQEELYHGRTAKQTQDFLTDELRPLMESMEARGVSLDEFEEYLHNRHAEERNEQIARINPNMPDGGSGIDTADARAYLAGLDATKRRAFDALAQRVDAITKGTRDLLVASGLETQDTIDKWEGAYSQYVPLNREDLDFSTTVSGTGTGQGYSVRGSSSRRATGSSRPVVDILANIAMQRERAIVRSQKNRVATAVYGLAASQPNTKFWLAVNPDAIKDPVKLQQELIGMGLNPIDAQNLIQEPKQTYIDPRTGLVAQRVNPALRSSANVLAVRVNGEDRYVFFNANDERSQRMVSALKNLDADQLGRMMTMAGQITRYFASVNTQYNPVFGAINFLRDTQGAALNLSTTPIADRKTRVMLDAGPALLGIYASLRSRRKGASPATGNWATLWEEFQKEGGQTGFRDMFRKSEERAVALQRMLDPSSWADSPLGKVFTVNGALKVPMEVARKQAAPLFDWLSDYNETMENAVRLSAYKAAKGKGLSNQQAASIAKNLTVNFNRKGQVATQAGALYAFFNAAVQGTTRLAETLRGPAGKKIMAGGLLLGSAQALLLAAAGFDDDEPPEFVRERNLIIPLGGSKYATIPMPLGFHVIPNTSRVLTEWAMSGWRDPARRVGQITGALIDAFNPIGNAGWSAQTLAPTIADPIVALSENKDWTGKPIAKKDMTSTDPTPGYTRAKDTASWLSKELAYYLNLATGGTKYKPGAFSPTPDQLDYLIGQVTGGVGRELIKVEQTVTSAVTGEELPPYKVPLVGRFVSDAQSSAAEANRFYKNVTRLNEHENEIKGRRENRENPAEYIRDNPEARLVNMANQVESDVQKLRRRKREMLERGASKESIRIIETQIANRMKRLNERVRTLQETAR